MVEVISPIEFSQQVSRAQNDLFHDPLEWPIPPNLNSALEHTVAQVQRFRKKHFGRNLAKIADDDRSKIVFLAAKHYSLMHPKSRFSVEELVSSVRFNSDNLNPQHVANTDWKGGITVYSKAGEFRARVLHAPTNKTTNAMSSTDMLFLVLDHEFGHKEGELIEGDIPEISECSSHKGQVRMRRGFNLIYPEFNFLTSFDSFADLEEVTNDYVSFHRRAQAKLPRYSYHGSASEKELARQRLAILHLVLKRAGMSPEELWQYRQKSDPVGFINRLLEGRFTQDDPNDIRMLIGVALLRDIQEPNDENLAVRGYLS